MLHKRYVDGRPWAIMGDFNVALNIEDTSTGMSSLPRCMLDFKDCVKEIEVVDLNKSGLHYTWNQKPLEGGGILKKLDRVMVNENFLQDFPSAHATFQPYRISYHSPAILRMMEDTKKSRPFKFLNIVTKNKEFENLVKEIWSEQVTCHKMYGLVKKVKNLKEPLRNLMWSKGNLHKRVTLLRKEVDETRKRLDQ